VKRVKRGFDLCSEHGREKDGGAVFHGSLNRGCLFIRMERLMRSQTNANHAYLPKGAEERLTGSDKNETVNEEAQRKATEKKDAPKVYCPQEKKDVPIWWCTGSFVQAKPTCPNLIEATIENGTKATVKCKLKGEKQKKQGMRT
jgi:hypothetical protein